MKCPEQLDGWCNFRGMTLSALARSLCDQSFGYNMTRGCTLKGREKGYDGVLNVGRVQSAVLGLVNMRTLFLRNWRQIPGLSPSKKKRGIRSGYGKPQNKARSFALHCLLKSLNRISPLCGLKSSLRSKPES